MNFALVTIFTLTLVVEGKGDVSWVNRSDVDLQPCQQKTNKSKYDEFVRRHILNETFNEEDYDTWCR